MTAPVRSTKEILAGVSVLAGSTEASPGRVGDWVDVTAFNGGQLAAFVTNGPSAPGVAGQFIWQGSDKNDGTDIVEIWRGGGNVTAGATAALPPIDLPREISYVRMVCFGNTVNPVTFNGKLFAKV